MILSDYSHTITKRFSSPKIILQTKKTPNQTFRAVNGEKYLGPLVFPFFPPVEVLLHGFDSSALEFRRLLPLLSDAGVEVGGTFLGG